MTFQNLFRRLLFATVTLGATAQVAHAQQNDDVQELKQRMTTMESKMDALIDMMAKQQVARSQPDIPSMATKSATAAVPEGFTSGIFLDVYSTDIHLKYSQNNDGFVLPVGYPSASVALEPTSSFSYGDFLAHNETENISQSHGSLIGEKYSGYLLIKQNGQHAFAISMNMPRYYSCIMQLYLNDSRVLSKYVYTDSHPSEKKDITLRPGLYKLDAFFACENPDVGGASGVPFKEIKAGLSMAEPGDRALHPVSPERLFVKS